MNKKIRILIADDHKIVRIGLLTLLQTEPDLKVVGEAKDGETAVAESLRTVPDVVIMDLMMPKKDGVSATLDLHKQLPKTKILILTSYSTADGIANALDAGASGAIMKTADDEDLLLALRKVAGGETYVSPDIRRLLQSDPPISKLTPRQLEVLESMTQGLTNKDIAKKLGICVDRVETHVNTLLTKLGAANRTEAVSIALRKHLLKI